MFDRAIVRNAKDGNWSVFDDCRGVLMATAHEEVLPLLETVERRAKNMFTPSAMWPMRPVTPLIVSFLNAVLICRWSASLYLTEKL